MKKKQCGGEETGGGKRGKNKSYKSEKIHEENQREGNHGKGTNGGAWMGSTIGSKPAKFYLESPPSRMRRPAKLILLLPYWNVPPDLKKNQSQREKKVSQKSRFTIVSEKGLVLGGDRATNSQQGSN